MQRLLLLLCLAACPAGCMIWSAGTIPANQVAPELQAKVAPRVTPFHLTSLTAPVQAQYRVQPGDLLEVTVADLLGENSASPIPVRIQEDGAIQLPLAGSISVTSLTLPECERTIVAAYRSKELLQAPRVMVSLRETRKLRVNILGAVNKPGQYELNGNEADLFSALVAAGGLTKEAGTAIEIHRRVVAGAGTQPAREQPRLITRQGLSGPSPSAGVRVVTASGSRQDVLSERGGEKTPSIIVVSVTGEKDTFGSVRPTSRSLPVGPDPALGPSEPKVIRLDLAQKVDKQKLAQGIYLQNGDTIVVDEPERKPIYVVGMVNRPGEIKVPPDRNVRLLAAIAMAGGVDRASLPNKIVVIRQRPDESGLVAIRIDLSRAKRDMAENIRLMPGDVVSVEETVSSYFRGLMRGALRIGVGAELAPTLY